ncbi:hypothetical protein DFH27DRAFT_112994 [Peziza echinospora]|nr:hypothetical protein DFH27DRAFT_112994 [Peziza echinospora]
MLPLLGADSVESGDSRKDPDVDVETKPGSVREQSGMHNLAQNIRARRDKLILHFRRRNTDPPDGTLMASSSPATPCSPCSPGVETAPGGPLEQQQQQQQQQQHNQHRDHHGPGERREQQHLGPHDEKLEGAYRGSVSGSSVVSSTREPTPELSRSEISQSETSRSRQSPSISTRRNSSFTAQQLELPPPHPRQVGDAAKPPAADATAILPPSLPGTRLSLPPPQPSPAAALAQQDPPHPLQHTADTSAAASPPSPAAQPAAALSSPAAAEAQAAAAEPPAASPSQQCSAVTAPAIANPTTSSDTASPATVAFCPLVSVHTPLAISTPASGYNTPITPSSVPDRERIRKQSLFPAHDISRIATALDIKGSLNTPEWSIKRHSTGGLNITSTPELRFDPEMIPGKVWVRRRDGSPTLVEYFENDLVDNLRDSILRKYQNALAKHFDAPDLQLKVVPRNGPNLPKRDERSLQPDEMVKDIIEEYFGGAQMATEALVVDVPQVVRERKTPRPSPNLPYAYYGGHETIIGAEGTGYFPEMPLAQSSHPISHPVPNINNSQNVPQQPSISILTSGQPSAVPPSPGTRGPRRPPYRTRMNTASPTVLTSTNANINLPSTPIVLNPRTGRSRGGSDAPPVNHALMQLQSQNQSILQNQNQIQAPGANQGLGQLQIQNQNQPLPLAPQPLPTPPIPEEKVSTPNASSAVGSPPPRVASPRPKFIKDKLKVTKPTTGGKLDSTVPPINVLIVEDNIINLKLLEAFMKRLKVRWQSAMNGREAVTKWRSGGFHLVLMDIQLPVMSGLEATKEIRRLERVNGIGVFSQTPGEEGAAPPPTAEVSEEDKLSSTIVFKSPVIIVALTASSLQSDRHEALAAGCNDFLTKPVNFIWLEKKVTEWGCMQALIDFDGWKKWKDFSMNVADRPVRINIKRDRLRSGQTALQLGQPSSQPLTPTTPGTPGLQTIDSAGDETPRTIMA